MRKLEWCGWKSLMICFDKMYECGGHTELLLAYTSHHSVIGSHGENYLICQAVAAQKD